MFDRLPLQRRLWKKTKLLGLLGLSASKQRTAVIRVEFQPRLAKSRSFRLLLVQLNDNSICRVKIGNSIFRILRGIFTRAIHSTLLFVRFISDDISLFACLALASPRLFLFGRLDIFHFERAKQTVLLCILLCDFSLSDKPLKSDLMFETFMIYHCP